MTSATFDTVPFPAKFLELRANLLRPVAATFCNVTGSYARGEGLTKAAALEVAEFGIRVNTVAPGPIETGMLNRFTGSAEKKAALVTGCADEALGTPEEIAQTILFVASDQASFIRVHLSPSMAENWRADSERSLLLNLHGGNLMLQPRNFDPQGFSTDC